MCVPLTKLFSLPSSAPNQDSRELQLRPSADHYFSAPAFFQTAVVRKIQDNTAEAKFQTYPTHIELFDDRGTFEIYVVPTVVGDYPFSRSDDSDDAAAKESDGARSHLRAVTCTRRSSAQLPGCSHRAGHEPMEHALWRRCRVRAPRSMHPSCSLRPPSHTSAQGRLHWNRLVHVRPVSDVWPRTVAAHQRRAHLDAGGRASAQFAEAQPPVPWHQLAHSPLDPGTC